jgi:hypothetical protein
VINIAQQALREFANVRVRQSISIIDSVKLAPDRAEDSKVNSSTAAMITERRVLRERVKNSMRICLIHPPDHDMVVDLLPLALGQAFFCF